MEAQDMLKILSSREQITEPTKRRVKVTSVTPFNDVDRGLRYIVNYAAMTPDGVAKALDLIDSGDFQGAGNTNLTSNQRLTDYLPTKGELVEIVVDWVPSRENPDVKKLRVVGVNPIAASASAKTDFVAMFEQRAKAKTANELELTSGK